MSVKETLKRSAEKPADATPSTPAGVRQVLIPERPAAQVAREADLALKVSAFSTRDED